MPGWSKVNLLRKAKSASASGSGGRRVRYRWLGSTKLEVEVKKFEDTLQKAKNVVEELQRSGEDLEKTVEICSALAQPTLAFTVLYQADLMERLGTNESVQSDDPIPIPGIHYYVKPDQVRPHAVALLRKHIDTASSDPDTLRHCLTNALLVLEKGTFITRSRVLHHLIAAYSLKYVLEERHEQYTCLFDRVRRMVNSFEEKGNNHKSDIETLKVIHGQMKDLLTDDSGLRKLKGCVEAGCRGDARLKEILKDIDKCARMVESRESFVTLRQAGDRQQATGSVPVRTMHEWTQEPSFFDRMRTMFYTIFSR